MAWPPVGEADDGGDWGGFFDTPEEAARHPWR
jgi:hypothetical protein